MITPCLMFSKNAGEAIDFYLSVFKNSRILSQSFYGEGMPLSKGTLLVATLKIQGLKVMIINGGPPCDFTMAMSLLVTCETQEEIDYYWHELTKEGGKELPCSWLQDKFGVSWQIAPRRMLELIADKDEAKAMRVFQAMMTMTKIDLARIEVAAKAL
jgi:predicted 3-demethylubiquinone-9 3-methyltransferase (glyoxalase superfamily)